MPEERTQGELPRDGLRLLGGCHCRAVRFRVSVRSRDVIRCNCSICTMKGYLHLIVDKADLEVSAGEDVLTRYTFNTGVASHRFCSCCGIHPFYVPRSHPSGYSVNVNCLDDPEALNWRERAFNGQDWETNIVHL